MTFTLRVSAVGARATGLQAIAVAMIVAALASGPGSSPLSAQETAKGRLEDGLEQIQVLSLPTVKAELGDFDRMQKHRRVRILVPYSRTLFFQDKGHVRGVTAEAASEFEKWLNKRYPAKPYKFYVALIPTPRDKLFQRLREGKGDIVAANLTVTPERSTVVDFSQPWISDVKEVLVTGPTAPAVKSLDDLSGHEIRVRPSSSYYGSLAALNKTLAKPIKITAIDENLEDEDLMEMVSAGLLPWVVVDSHKAKLWSAILPDLTVREDVVIREDGDIAWAFRKNSPLLRAEIDAFMAEVRGKATMSDILYRYYKTGKTVRNALSSKDREKFEQIIGHFKTYGKRFKIDPFLLTAQGYQESGFDQSMRMRSGAVGVMQIKPSTAREKEIGITDVVTRAEDNIHAGAKYLRFLANKYIKDRAVSEPNRVLMALAAYNAGPGNLRKFRDMARKRGLDPDKWFGNVEQGAAAIVGQETVQYVGNIYKYYVVYSSIIDKKE